MTASAPIREGGGFGPPDPAADPPRKCPAPEFISLEKNLTSLCFFTPLKKQVKKVRSKTVTFSRGAGGERVEARVRISADEEYGLPTTSDQDKYFALQKLIGDRIRRGGEVTNPVAFTSAEIIRELGHRDGGGNYRDVGEWLDRMTATTIISTGAVYLAGKRRWVSDRFHVFERAVSAGRHLPGGGVADRNYVWLSDWQLENFRSGHLLPLDFETYKSLRNHVAKALAPLLQVWLYASRGEGVFEKRYEELCQMLGLTRYRHASKVREKLGPGLDELVKYGYISRWDLKPSKDLTGYVLVLYHGEKFHRDRRRRLARPGPGPEVMNVCESAATTHMIQTPPSRMGEPSSSRNPEEVTLIDRLCHDFGIVRSQAESLVDSSPGEVKAQLAAYPWRGVKPLNPAGWIVTAVRNAYRLPEAYLEARRKEEKKAELGARLTDINACPYCRDTEGWRLTTKGARRCTHDRAKEEGDADVI